MRSLDELRRLPAQALTSLTDEEIDALFDSVAAEIGPQPEIRVYRDGEIIQKDEAIEVAFPLLFRGQCLVPVNIQEVKQFVVRADGHLSPEDNGPRQAH